MKKNRNKDGWMLIDYDGGSSLEVRHVTTQCVKKAFDNAGIRYKADSFEVLKDDSSD